VIVAGRPSYAESGEVAAEAVRALAAALPKATFLPALRRGNVFGALDMGLAPGCSRVGQPRRGSPALHRRLGLGARRRRPVDGRHPGVHGRRDRWRHRSRWHRRACPGAARADPLDDFPDRAVAAKALGAGHSWWPSPAIPPSRSTPTPMSCCRAR